LLWPTTIAEAIELQQRLRPLVRIIPFPGRPQLVAGVDAAFSDRQVFAAACLYSLPDLKCIERSTAVLHLRFPYVPGFLSFREGPAITLALRRLRHKPDIVLVDGQGIAHPRGIGLASHIGVLLDMPMVGCAKTRLVGEYHEPERSKGSWSELLHRGTIVGGVLRTRNDVRPLFVSPGHRIDLHGSLSVVLACTVKYRIPEPLRCADHESRRKRDGR
jgi:deoxyribonuclease V